MYYLDDISRIVFAQVIIPLEVWKTATRDTSRQIGFQLDLYSRFQSAYEMVAVVVISKELCMDGRLDISSPA